MSESNWSEDAPMSGTNGNESTNNDTLDDDDSLSYILTNLQMRKEGSYYRWNIDDFRSFSDHGPNKSKSKKLLGGYASQNTWRLSVNVHGQDIKFLMTLFKRGDQEHAVQPLFMKWSISLLTANDSVKMINYCDRRRYYETQARRRSFVIPRVSVEPEPFITFPIGSILSCSELLENDTLRIECNIELTDDIEVVHEALDNNPAVMFTVFTQHFKQVLKSGDYSDVTVKSQSDTFKAHKIVLSCHSSDFQEMFQKAVFQKKKLGVIDMSHLSDEIVAEMLEFMYTGKMKKEKALEMLDVAVFYKLTGLKEFCVKTISEDVNDSNALEILGTADKFHLFDLKAKAIAFINGNKRDFHNGKELQVLAQNNPNLLLELYLSE